MEHRLRNPRLTALALGATYGIVQGLRLPEEPLLTSASSASELLLVGIFGLLGPPALAALQYVLAGGPPRFPRWWERVELHFDPFFFFFAVAATFAASGAYALGNAEAQGGYQVCVFLGALAPSFLAASFHRHRSMRRAAPHVI